MQALGDRQENGCHDKQSKCRTAWLKCPHAAMTHGWPGHGYSEVPADVGPAQVHRVRAPASLGERARPGSWAAVFALRPQGGRRKGTNPFPGAPPS